MAPELHSAMYEARKHLSASSLERYRDELFKLIRLHKNAEAAAMLNKFGILDHLFPDWDHDSSFDSVLVENVDHFLNLLTEGNADSSGLNDFDVYAASRLGNYKKTLKAFFDQPLALYHNRRMLNVFAAMANTLDSRIEVMQSWCSRLAFSCSETNFVTGALKSFEMLKNFEAPASCTDVDIYRYFRSYKESGIAGLILFLADAYRYQDVPNAYKVWCDRVVFVQNMISAYFTRYMEVIAPFPLMSGHDIQELLKIPAGPVIGQIKNALIEAQISGTVRNMLEAESFVRLEAKHYQ